MYTQKKNAAPDPANTATAKSLVPAAEEKEEYAADNEEHEAEDSGQDWPDLDSLNQRSEPFGPAGFNRLLGCGG